MFEKKIETTKLTKVTKKTSPKKDSCSCPFLISFGEFGEFGG
jgi:hypothetical protein